MNSNDKLSVLDGAINCLLRDVLNIDPNPTASDIVSYSKRSASMLPSLLSKKTYKIIKMLLSATGMLAVQKTPRGSRTPVTYIITSGKDDMIRCVCLNRPTYLKVGNKGSPKMIVQKAKLGKS